MTRLVLTVANDTDRDAIYAARHRGYATELAADLVGSPARLDELRPNRPPRAVSLVGQMAACAALGADDYYADRWAETAELRESLAARLCGLGWDVVPGCANFLLCHMPVTVPTTAALLPMLQSCKLYLRPHCACGWGGGHENAQAMEVTDGASGPT